MVQAYLTQLLGAGDAHHPVFSPLKGMERHCMGSVPSDKNRLLAAACANAAAGLDCSTAEGRRRVLLLDDDENNVAEARRAGFRAEAAKEGAGMSIELFMNYLRCSL